MSGFFIKHIAISRLKTQSKVSANADPYLRIVYGDTSYQTSTIMKTLQPEWDEKFPFQYHHSKEELIVECWDWHALRRTLFLGECRLTEKDLKKASEVTSSLKINEEETGEIQISIEIGEIGEHTTTSAERKKKTHPPVDPTLKLYKDFGTNIFRSLSGYKMALLIGNYKYNDPNIAGENSESSNVFSRYVKSDLKKIKGWLMSSCGYKEEDVEIVRNKSAPDVKTIYDNFKEKVWKKRDTLVAPHAKKKKIEKDDSDLLRLQNELGGKCGVLIFVYYSGHGVMSDGHTYVVCPEYVKDHPLKNAAVDIDILIGQLAAIPDTFVVSMLDCCRIKVDFEDDEKRKENISVNSYEQYREEKKND